MALTIYEQQQIILAEDARPALRQLQRIPADQLQLVAKLVGPNGEEIALPPSLIGVLQAAARLLLEGKGIVIVPTDRALTTQEAADFLNMSRQYLVELLERGEIPFTKTGTHRRVKFHDLLAYKARRDAQGREILDELTRLGQEMGN
jgi:excisionase family DNA binding protein